MQVEAHFGTLTDKQVGLSRWLHIADVDTTRDGPVAKPGQTAWRSQGAYVLPNT